MAVVELVGAWRLVSCVQRANGTIVGYPFGEQPTGVLLYTADHRVSVHLSSGDRELLSDADFSRMEAAETARAFASYLGYCGRYELRGDTVIHKIEMCSVPNWVGRDQVRQIRMIGDVLALYPPAQGADGSGRLELCWSRSD